jgi:hypothetical protein
MMKMMMMMLVKVIITTTCLFYTLLYERTWKYNYAFKNTDDRIIQ